MRWPPVVAALVFIAIAAAWLDHESGHGEGIAGSTLSHGERGTSLAMAYLASEPGRQVGILDRPLTLRTVAPTATVMRLEPSGGEPADPQDTPEPLSDSERAWIEAGGRLVIALSGPWRGMRTAATGPAEPALPLLPGVRVLAGEARGLSGDLLGDAVPAFMVAGVPAVCRVRLGNGELWLLGCPEALENAGLPRGDHLALLAALAGDGRAVLFDERSTGTISAGGVTTVLLGWGLGGSLLLVVLILILIAWRRAAVLGPESPPADPPQVGAVDGVPAVAALYERAMPARACIDLHYRRLLRTAATRHGGPAAGKAAIERLLPRWRLPASADPSAFRAALQRLNHAFRSLRDAPSHRRP